VTLMRGEVSKLAAIDGDDLERLAGLVVAKLLNVRQVAELLGVPPDYVYRHKEALGVIRLPSEGRRGALRFDRDTLRERLRERAASSTAAPSGSRRRARQSEGRAAVAELLPVRPRMAA
jgi:hypothetical protein